MFKTLGRSYQLYNQQPFRKHDRKVMLSLQRSRPYGCLPIGFDHTGESREERRARGAEDEGGVQPFFIDDVNFASFTVTV